MSDETVCAHEPDFMAARPADGVGITGIIDVPCRLCGASGSVVIALEDIQWD